MGNPLKEKALCQEMGCLVICGKKELSLDVLPGDLDFGLNGGVPFGDGVKGFGGSIIGRRIAIFAGTLSSFPFSPALLSLLFRF